MKPYLIFMDIDGTLVDDHQRVSAVTKNTIQKLIAAGQHFFIASGRMLASAGVIAKEISPQVDVIGSNGGAYSLDGQLITHHLGAAALKALDPIIREQHLPTFFFTDHQVLYTEKLPSYFQHSEQNRIASNNAADYVAVPDQASLLKFADQIVNGIVIDDQHPDQLGVVRQKMVTLPNLSVSSSAANNLELIPAGVSKATAIQEICQQLHQPLARTIAFGDGENDLPMITTAGVGVAMANATEAVKQQANYTTASNLDDGVAKFLTNYLSKES